MYTDFEPENQLRGGERGEGVGGRLVETELHVGRLALLVPAVPAMGDGPVPIAGQAPQEDAGATAATARNSTRRPAVPHAEPSGNLAEAHRERGALVPDPSRSLTTSTCLDARRRPTEACRTTSASCVAMMSAVPKERCGSRMRSMTCSADPSSRAPSTVRSADSPLPGTPRRTTASPGPAEHEIPSGTVTDPSATDGSSSAPSTRPSPPIPDRPVRAARPPPPVPSLPDASRDRRERPPSPRPGIGLPRRTRRPPHDGGPAPWGARRVMGTNDA